LYDDAALDICRGMKHVEKRTLIVEDSIQGDVYKDIARLHWKERGRGAIESAQLSRFELMTGLAISSPCEDLITKILAKSDLTLLRVKP